MTREDARALGGRAGRVILGVVAGVYAAFAVGLVHHAGTFGMDSYAYWLAMGDPTSWYQRVPGEYGAYFYSPAFAQALWPASWMTWPLFCAAWVALNTGLVVWLVRPLGAFYGLVLAALAVPEVLTGNIFLLLAASLVLMLRGHPWAVVLPLLTKVTPGVGVVIFIVRRDWKSLAVACSAVGVVFTLSALLDVDPWWHWATMLVTTGGEGQRWLVAAKAVVAVVLVVLAERLDRPWLIVVGVLCAMPVILGPSPLALLLAIPRLRRRNRVADDGDAAEDRGGHVPVLQR